MIDPNFKYYLHLLDLLNYFFKYSARDPPRQGKVIPSVVTGNERVDLAEQFIGISESEYSCVLIHAYCNLQMCGCMYIRVLEGVRKALPSAGPLKLHRAQSSWINVTSGARPIL